MMILFTTDGGSPQFFAGLGSPWRITTDIEFAVKVADSNRELYRRGLERYTNLTWQAAPLKELLPQKFFSCGECETSWSHEEGMCAVSGLDPQDFGIPIGSKLYNPVLREEFISAIKKPTQCTKCGKLLCYNHTPNTRGRGAGHCQACKKADRVARRD